MHQSVCDTCGSTDHRPVTRKRTFRIHRCASCGHLFVCPLPPVEELRNLYQASRGYFKTASIDLARTSAANSRAVIRLLARHGIRKGRFHDIGCANGRLIYHMREQGWEVSGNDFNEDALKVARSHNLEVFHGAFEDCGFPDDHFDAVFLGDSIEHVMSPKALLKDIRRTLRPGGLVYIVTPNAESGFARYSLVLSRLAGLDWAHSEAPFHLHDFTPGSMRHLMESVGVPICSLMFVRRGSFKYVVGSTGHFDELKKQMKESGGYSVQLRLIKHVPALAAVSAVLLPIWVFGRMADRLGSAGRGMVVIGRKATS